MNGSGYPRSLKGDEIMIEARILTVADLLEVIESHIVPAWTFMQLWQKSKRIEASFTT
jgi:response regulator RpfG family c-di-GMP phosphodiesterase